MFSLSRVVVFSRCLSRSTSLCPTPLAYLPIVAINNVRCIVNAKHVISSSKSTTPLQTSPPHISGSPFSIVSGDISLLTSSLTRLIGSDHPVLSTVSSYLFMSDGKRLRPALVLLTAKAMTAHAEYIGIKLNSNESESTAGCGDRSSKSLDDWDRSVLSGMGKAWRFIGAIGLTSNRNNSSINAVCGDATNIVAELNGDVFSSHRRLAEVTEMIHTASLLHDDVIDNSTTRRGKAAGHVMFGNKLAILAGDYLLGRASVILTKLRPVKVIEVMSSVIEDLILGEIMQMQLAKPTALSSAVSDATKRANDIQSGRRLVTDINFCRDVGVVEIKWNQVHGMHQYMEKTFYKTASLLAKGCQSAALLSLGSEDSNHNSGACQNPATSVSDVTNSSTIDSQQKNAINAAYLYGRHLGIAFQLVDDCLDYIGTTSVLGKVARRDLREGHITAPFLLALEQCGELRDIARSGLSNDTIIDQAYNLVCSSSSSFAGISGVTLTRRLAAWHVERAVEAIESLTPSPARDALVSIARQSILRHS